MKNTEKKNLFLSVALICLSVSILILSCVLVYVFGNKNDKENNMIVDQTTINNENLKQDTVSEKEYEIKTPYGNLYYPKKWKEYLHIEKIEQDAYIVEFYAKIEDKKEIHLFDIVFNGEGTEVKTLTLSNGEKLVVSMVPYENDFDKTWSEKEQQIVWEMREDISYLYDRLSEMEN